MVDKLKSNKLNTLLHLGDIIGVVRNNVTTNLTQAQLLVLANYFSDLGNGAIHQAQVPYVDDITLADGGDAIVPNEQARARLVRKMLIAPPAPEPPADPVRIAEIMPSMVQVDIENGSGVTGAAHVLAIMLQKQGFKIGAVGNAPSDVAVTEIHQHSDTPFVGVRVRNALPPALRNAHIINDGTAMATPSGTVSDVTVILGPVPRQ